MPRIVRSIQTYQNNLQNNIGALSHSTQKELFYDLGVNSRTYINNKLTMLNQLPEQPVISIPIEEESAKYHTGAKYGASKYTGSLQSGKMHKLIRNST